MNSWKLPSVKLIMRRPMDRLPWIRDFETWQQCMQSGQSPSRCGLDGLTDGVALQNLRQEAKRYQVQLPILLEPNRHFGYDVLPLVDLEPGLPQFTDLQQFLTVRSPFVPALLVCLVNCLEDSCCNIEYLYAKRPRLCLARAQRLLLSLVSLTKQEEMCSVIRLESVDTVAVAVQLFLHSLCPALLMATDTHEDKHHQQDPVTAASRHCACFILIHLLHVWEFCKDPLVTLELLANEFGPLLLYHSPSSSTSFQNMLMDNDYDFWYRLSGQPSRMLHLFHGVSARELRLFQQVIGGKKIRSHSVSATAVKQ